MKIAVVGTGAMGSIYAGLLADAGHEVWAIDIWQDHLDAITQFGLRVEGASGDRTVRGIRVASDATKAEECDLYVIATKASGVEAAARGVAQVMSPSSMVLTIQNGLGAGERIAQFMPTDNVLLGVAEGFGASIKAPGHAHHNSMNLIRIGEMAGGMTSRLKSVEAIWQSGGFNVRAFADIEQLIWEKFVCNVTFSAPCTAFEYTIGQLMADPSTWAVAKAAALEAFAVGKAQAVTFSYDNAIDYVTEFGSRMPLTRPSMYLDHLAKRPSEIDAINGMVPILGQRYNIATPYNETLTALVKRRELAFG